MENDEVDLMELFKTIWSSRKQIIKITIIFFVVGLIIALGSKVEYEASTKLLPESQEGITPNLGRLGGLAGLAGINLDAGGQGSISPKLYPQIVQSLPYQMEIIHEPIRFEKNDTTISSYNYFKEIDSPSFLSIISQYTIGLPGKIRGLFKEKDTISDIEDKNNQIIRLTQEDHLLIQTFKDRISITMDNESGMIILTSKMPDPMAAADLANSGVKLLQDKIVEYKINKAKHNLEFVRERYKEAKINFEKVQEKLAIFNDRHRNVVTAVAQTEKQRLQNEHDVTFEVYKSLATQLEQAQIKVKEATPVFTSIEPVQVPLKKSEPRRKLIVVISILAGLTIGTSYVLIGLVFKSLMKDN